jgi:cell division protease FtsH
MTLRRYFRAPLLLIAAVALLLLSFALYHANSGPSYQRTGASEIINLVNQGQVKSALIIDKTHEIQVTTKSGKQLEASWASRQGAQLQNALQAQFNKGNLPGGYNISTPGGNTLLDVLPAVFIFLAAFLLSVFAAWQIWLTAARGRRRTPRADAGA